LRGCEETEAPDVSDAIGLAEALLSCATRAEAHDRMMVELRDLACFGRPARLVWRKRRRRCREELCDARTWTEHSEHVDTLAVITRRARRLSR
jgi:hypothetical protein